MATFRQPQAPLPELHENDNGKITETEDPRMPDTQDSFRNRDLKARTQWLIGPANAVGSFYLSEVGTKKLVFHFTGKQNLLVDWTKSYLEFGIVPCLAVGGTPLTNTEIDTWGYAPPTTKADILASRSAAGKAYKTIAAKNGKVKFLQIPGTHALFKRWQLIDWRGNPVIDDQKRSDVFSQVMLQGMKPEFFENDSTNRCDDFAAAANHYKYDSDLSSTYSTNHPSPSHQIPWTPNVAAPVNTYTEEVATPDAWTVTAPTADQQTAPLSEVTQTARLMVNGSRFKVMSPLGYMRSEKFYYSAENPMSLVLELNEFGEAFFGLNATCVGASRAAGTKPVEEVKEPPTPAVAEIAGVVTEEKAWVVNGYGMDYRITDIVLHLDVYQLSDSGKAKIDSICHTEGYKLKYPQVISESLEFTAGRHVMRKFINRDIHDLQKAIIVIREAENVRNDVKRPKLLFTNGELTQTSTNRDAYEGLESFNWKYLDRSMPSDPIRTGPLNMRMMRKLSSEIWETNDNCVMVPYYEGVSDGVYHKHQSTQFFIATNFMKQAWASSNGIDLALSDIEPEFWFRESGVSKTIDFFFVHETEITVKGGHCSLPRK